METRAKDEASVIHNSLEKGVENTSLTELAGGWTKKASILKFSNNVSH